MFTAVIIFQCYLGFWQIQFLNEITYINILKEIKLSFADNALIGLGHQRDCSIKITKFYRRDL